MAVTLSDYRRALGAPRAALPVLASALARLPIAMVGLATLFYVQRMSGSFAVAGAVSAGVLSGNAIGAVGQGRIMDRRGPSGPLLAVALGFALAAAGLILAIERGVPLWGLVPIALLTGAATPAMSGASRALWERLVPEGPRREAAFSYEAISMEVFFILGPALAAILLPLPWAGTGLLVAVSAMTLGTIGFALSGPVRESLPVPRSTEAGLLGVIAGRGMQTVALASLGFGLVIGSVEVGVPAMAVRLGEPQLGGIVLSAWSVVSVLVGLLYGMRPWPRSLHLRIPVLMAGFAGMIVLTAVVFGASGSVLALVALLLVSGGLITPQVTGHSLAADLVAPEGTATEAFGWVITAATLGIAIGQSAGGVMIETAGAGGAFVAGGLAGLAVAALLWLLRHSVSAHLPGERAAAVRPATPFAQA